MKHPPSLHPEIHAVTERIRKRSHELRKQYLDGIAASRQSSPSRTRLSCGNLAHGFAGCTPVDKQLLKTGITPNLAIVSAYNDMLSAHEPYESYPALIREHARSIGATAQMAGGVPAMCDGVTQGRPGMELSLMSRDIIAQSTAIALTHDMFDAAVCLGICDKIVPGLLIGALAFGHLPIVFIPSGPMTSGLPNKEKAAVRERYAAGLASKEELLEAESASYHSPGTCTFYGTANSNQVLLEAMGVQMPGSSFIQPGTELRKQLTLSAVEQALANTALGEDYRPFGELIDERASVNAIVALMATGGSTNHTIHWIAVARAAGIILTWEDMNAISRVVPLLARIYPNGEADVNDFEHAGGTAFIFRELIDAGLMHADILTMLPQGFHAWRAQPYLDHGNLRYRALPAENTARDVVRNIHDPFEDQGGLRLLKGNLGRSLIKISAVKPEYRFIEAPAVVVDAPQALNALHSADALPEHFVAVVRFQGPHANGMPELHSLAPLLGMLQNQGRRVALVTDGRLSGASGKIPAAIHVTPESAHGGPLAKLREGDIIRLDAIAGTLDVLIDADEWEARQAVADSTPPARDLGRNLFAFNRAVISPADRGALSISCGPPSARGDAWQYDAEYDLGDGIEAMDAPMDEKDA